MLRFFARDEHIFDRDYPNICAVFVGFTKDVVDDAVNVLNGDPVVYHPEFKQYSTPSSWSWTKREDCSFYFGWPDQSEFGPTEYQLAIEVLGEDYFA